MSFYKVCSADGAADFCLSFFLGGAKMYFDCQVFSQDLILNNQFEERKIRKIKTCKWLTFEAKLNHNSFSSFKFRREALN